jgi:hypothetical protein
MKIQSIYITPDYGKMEANEGDTTIHRRLSKFNIARVFALIEKIFDEQREDVVKDATKPFVALADFSEVEEGSID